MLRASASSRRNCHLKRRKRHRVTHARETGEDEDAGGEVLDLMEALRRSVQASRGRKPAAAKKPSVVKETVVAKKAVSAKKPSAAKKSAAAKKPSAAKNSAAAKKQSASIKFGVKRAG